MSRLEEVGQLARRIQGVSGAIHGSIRSALTIIEEYIMEALHDLLMKLLASI